MKKKKTNEKRTFLKILKTAGKNFLAFIISAIIAEVILLVFFIGPILKSAAEKAGLGFIILGPLIILYLSLFAIVGGGVVGIIAYNIYKLRKKSKHKKK